MGRNKRLNEFEKGQINAYHMQGLSNRKIGKLINRCDYVIRKYLKNPDNYGNNYSGRRPQAMDSRTKRQVFRDFANTGESINKIRARNQVKASKTTVWRQLKDNRNFEYRKRKVRPRLTPVHIECRLQWAKNHFSWSNEWRRVIFSDEKKFNLDGPDGYQYYWHDIRKEEQWYSKRVCGGGSVMVWAGIGWNGKTNIAIIEGKNNSKSYIDILNTYLLPFAPRISCEDYIFQQDNSSVHTSKVVNNWFKSQNIKVIEWPSLSPDLNIIENIWGYLVRKVYDNGRQFENREDLKIEIFNAWEELSQDYIQNLFNSLPNRLFELTLKKGNKINY
jgi:hypothetical protein